MTLSSYTVRTSIAVSDIARAAEFYERKLVEVPSKQSYIQKMLYMLHSIKEPFDAGKMA